MKKVLAVLLATVMVASLTACGVEEKPVETGSQTSSEVTSSFEEVGESTAVSEEVPSDSEEESLSSEDPSESRTTISYKGIGEGKHQFSFKIVTEDSEYYYYVRTDETKLGEALVSLNLIDGEESEFGLYVKEVDGIRADYDKDGAYWFFYKDGDALTAGVDSITIEDYAQYEAVYTKA